MLITVELNACYGVNISKNTQIKISNRGARARRAGAGSAFDFNYKKSHFTVSLKCFVHACQLWGLIIKRNFSCLQNARLDFIIHLARQSVGIASTKVLVQWRMDIAPKAVKTIICTHVVKVVFTHKKRLVLYSSTN